MPTGDGGSLRMAHAEAGPADGPPVLLLHGEPTWSYCRPSSPGARGRRHPVLEGAGHFLQEDAGEELGREIAAFVCDR